MEEYLKILAAVAPAVVLGVNLVGKDKRSEPLMWLLAAVGLGMLVVPAVILFGSLFLPEMPADSYMGAVYKSFIEAAIPEEGFKFLALYLLATKCRYFDELFDGLVYAVCIGMGFAGIENIMYLVGAGDQWLTVGITRALLSVPAHYAFAVIMGTFFALGWFDSRNRNFYLTAALIIPVIVHGLYDTFCFSMDIDEDVAAIIVIAFIVAYRYIRRYVKSLVTSMIKLDDYRNYGK